MRKDKNSEKARQLIEQEGVLLVFPLNNAKEPRSLWNLFYPRTPLRWEWDEDGDDRVMRMWQLMKSLSSQKEVVYSKWYQGRATFFSRSLFTALMTLRTERDCDERRLSLHAREILEVLQTDSPLSTKQLKKITDLQGKMFSGAYEKAMKELFRHFWIVGCGELDDGAFPSLLVGATQLIYEDLWFKAREMNRDLALKLREQYMPEGTLFRKFYQKIQSD